MDELRIGEVIFALRKEKRLTQEEFGNIIGVSKGAVSKWESNLTYPDIVLLPKIAGFFNISIDRLMNFNSEISEEEICEFYKECSEEALVGNIDMTIEKCEGYLKKYSRSYKLKFMLAGAMILGTTFIKDEEKIRNIKNRAMKLYREVMENSTNIEEVESAILMLATFYGDEKEYSKAYLILDRVKKFNREATSIKGSLLLKEGKIKEARKIHQEILLSSLGNLQASLMAISNSYKGEADKQIEILEAVEKIYKVFTTGKMSKGLSSVYMAKAQVYADQLDKKMTLENLKLLFTSLNEKEGEIKDILISEIPKGNIGLDGNRIMDKMAKEELEDKRYDFLREEVVELKMEN